MAIYHCHIDTYRRSEGKTAVGGAAYRRGIKTKCDITGKHFDFSRKSEVVFSKFIKADCDNREHDFSTIKLLFEEVEKNEKRGDATLGKEIECGLPIELSLNQQIELTENFVSRIRKEAKAENAFFDMSIHNKENNPHVHICMSERELIKTEYGFKFSNKNRDWHDKGFVSVLRKLWEEEANNALEKAGLAQRVDCRTLEAQGIEKIPTLHEGKSRHINHGDRKMTNEKIKQKNEELKTVKPIQIPKDDFDITELQTKSILSACRNPDDDKKKRDKKKKDDEEAYQYRLAKEQYEESFAILGLKYINTKNPKQVTLWFNDRSNLIDKGDLITAGGGTDKDNAQRMVELAKLKKWKSIAFTGSDSFLEEAFKQALAQNLEIVPEGEAQQALLDKIKVKSQLASVITAKTPAVSVSTTPQPEPTRKRGFKL